MKYVANLIIIVCMLLLTTQTWAEETETRTFKGKIKLDFPNEKIILDLREVPSETPTDAKPDSTRNEVTYTPWKSRAVIARVLRAEDLQGLTLEDLIRNCQVIDQRLLKHKDGRIAPLLIEELTAYRSSFPAYSDFTYVKIGEAEAKGTVLFMDNSGRLSRSGINKTDGYTTGDPLVVQSAAPLIEQDYLLSSIVHIPIISQSQLPGNYLELITGPDSCFNSATWTLTLKDNKPVRAGMVEIGVYEKKGEEDSFTKMEELKKHGTVFQYAEHPTCYQPGSGKCIIDGKDKQHPAIENGWMRSKYPWVDLIISQ